MGRTTIGWNATRRTDSAEEAFKFGTNWGGMVLLFPVCLVFLLLMFLSPAFCVALNGSGNAFFYVAGSYIILVVLPCSACLSTALIAYTPNGPVDAILAEGGARGRTWRAMFRKYAAALLPAGAVVLGAMWRSNQEGRALPSGYLVAVLSGTVAALLVLAFGCWVGQHLGASARSDRGGYAGRFLGWCWGKFQSSRQS